MNLEGKHIKLRGSLNDMRINVVWAVVLSDQRWFCVKALEDR